MNKKAKIILSVIYLVKKIWGRTYLQKFVYLLNREIYNRDLFQYKYYKYGPFCSEINDILTDFEFEDVIEETAEETKGLNTAYTYTLTKKGEEIAKKVFHSELTVKERDQLMNYANEFKEFTPTELLLYVYKKYPEATVNSVFGRD